MHLHTVLSSVANGIYQYRSNNPLDNTKTCIATALQSTPIGIILISKNYSVVTVDQKGRQTLGDEINVHLGWLKVAPTRKLNRRLREERNF